MSNTFVKPTMPTITTADPILRSLATVLFNPEAGHVSRQQVLKTLYRRATSGDAEAAKIVEQAQGLDLNEYVQPPPQTYGKRRAAYLKRLDEFFEGKRGQILASDRAHQEEMNVLRDILFSTEATANERRQALQQLKARAVQGDQYAIAVIKAFRQTQSD